ncbi:MAG: replicative DNA helicase [Candidatus Levybacteria bacterium]|nr:replicative DNA helicase [Candidatus Levybacteria bacterium]MBP9815369.1 replicative DNA helicase [Candidatus Levybacteria bacterium]
MPQRIPPHDTDAEQAVLGCILIDKEAATLGSELIKADYFYDDNHSEIFLAMVELYEARKPIDLVTLTSQLKARKMYEKVGGASYLTMLVNAVPTASNIEHYTGILREKYVRRRLITLAGHMTEQAFSEEGETPEVLDKVEQDVFKISQERIKQGFIHIKDSLAESFDRLDQLQKDGGRFRGVETGFVDLDFLLSGLQPSNLIVLAARPGQGKTAFVVNIAQHITIHSKLPVGVFSLEMSKEELVDRLLVSQSDIDAWRLKTGRLSEDDFEKLSTAMGELAEAPIFIDDTPGISIAEIRTKARRLQAESGLKLLIVDYLQLVNPGRRFENRVQEVSYVSQNLKNLARELKIPVIAVSQLSRAVEHRGERKPQLADLRESGAIEQDADVVMFLYTKDEEFSSQRIVSINIAKHRNGPVGEKDLLFRGDRIRFYNIEGKREDTPPPLQN